MKATLLAACVLLSTSFALGCAGSQSEPSDASEAKESAESEPKVQRRGFDRLERLQN